MSEETLGQWLDKKCREEKMSLRDAAKKTGLSHSTIKAIISTSHAHPVTVKKLALAFGGNGDHQISTLEDKLLVLTGCRSGQPDAELSEPMARLLDKVSRFSVPQLKVLNRFADFISEMESK